MTTAPAQLLWECIKGHNAFIRKGLNGAIFSAEPGNLYNKHSYKFSGKLSWEVLQPGRRRGIALSTLLQERARVAASVD